MRPKGRAEAWPAGWRRAQGALQAPADLEEGEALTPDHGLGEDPGKRDQGRDQRIEVVVFDGRAAEQRSMMLRDS